MTKIRAVWFVVETVLKPEYMYINTVHRAGSPTACGCSAWGFQLTALPSPTKMTCARGAGIPGLARLQVNICNKKEVRSKSVVLCRSDCPVIPAPGDVKRTWDILSLLRQEVIPAVIKS